MYIYRAPRARTSSIARLIYFFDEEAKKMPGPGPGPGIFCLLVKKNKSAEQFVIGRARKPVIILPGMICYNLTWNDLL